jgi:hypothetical protein
MKRLISIICCLSVYFVLCAQNTPIWLEENAREVHYPSETFYTGFVYNIIEQGKSLPDLIEKTKADAQADLVKKIRVKIETKAQSNIYSQSKNGNYIESEVFSNDAKTTANAEVVGIKTESYYDPKLKTVYAFATANRSELKAYYKNILSMTISQVEGLVQTATNLEVNAEKTKARQLCEEAKPLLEKVRHMQDMLTAIDSNIASEDLQQSKVEKFYDTLTQMLAKLAQATYVYVESKEDLFGTPVNVVANKLKAELSINGCSFTDNLGGADFQLKLKVTTRMSTGNSDFVFCYADASVELYDTHKQKVLYSDEIEQKGASNSQDKAGRKAMNDVVPRIADKLKIWIK